MQVEENCLINAFNKDCELHDCVKDKLNPSVKSALYKIIKKEEYLSYKVHARALAADGGNYLAKLFIVDVIGRTDKGDKEINIFLKQSLSPDGLHGFISMEEAYLKEVFFYTELCALYKKLQTDAGIQPNEMLKTVKYYNESSTDAIIMENLKKRGFNVLFRMDVVPFKFAKLAVEQLAKLHALSFVVQKRMPEYFNKKKETFRPVINFNVHFEKFLVKVVDMAIKEFDEDAREKITKNYSLLFSKYMKYFTDTVSSVNCFCHGDFKPNNILMKEIDGEIMEVIPIDYQLLFYGSPTTDLIYFIYNGTDAKFRQDHEDDLKDIYFKGLEQFLRHFEMDVDTVFPRKVFEEDYEKVREYGFCISLMVLPFAFIEENNVPDVENSEIMEVNLKIDKKYYARISEIYNELIHLVEY